MKGTLPDFLIIGTQKGGTSSLYKYLIRHPNILPASRKEIHFFDQYYHKGLQWYKKQFPAGHSNKNITGEATPYYLFHPHAPQKISHLLPNVKLIVLLRNPVDRAYSHYQMVVRQGNEKVSFNEAIKKENKRIQGELKKLATRPYYFSKKHRDYSYLSRGIYINQLKQWMEYYPRKQFLILRSEDLFSKPKYIVEQCLQFLRVPVYNFDINKYQPVNKGRYKGLDAKTRDQLMKYFQPYNQQLEKYLKMKFYWDRK